MERSFLWKHIWLEARGCGTNSSTDTNINGHTFRKRFGPNASNSMLKELTKSLQQRR
jgi:hypothetical protein